MEEMALVSGTEESSDMNIPVAHTSFQGMGHQIRTAKDMAELT
jgi:hypothetical protein